MDCAACARKVENAVRQIRGVNQAQVLFATEKLVVDADTDLRAQIEHAVQKAGYTLRSEDSRDAAPESRLKENLPLITLIIMMAISWGWSNLTTRSANWPLSPPPRRSVSYCPPCAAADEKRQLVRY